MVLKRPFFSDNGEALYLYIHWWVLGETDLQSVLGDRVSSLYDSFSENMVLKRPFISDTFEALSHHGHCSAPGRQSFKLFSWETGFWVYMIVLVGRWSWKGNLSVILGEASSLHIHSSSVGEGEHQTILWGTELWVGMIAFVGRWSWTGH